MPQPLLLHLSRQQDQETVTLDPRATPQQHLSKNNLTLLTTYYLTVYLSKHFSTVEPHDVLCQKPFRKNINSRYRRRKPQKNSPPLMDSDPVPFIIKHDLY